MTTKTAATKPERKSPARNAAVPAKRAEARTPGPGAKEAKKEQKVKVVRDSFTMPQDEYAKIADIKAACLKAKQRVKKSEVLRAGLKLLAALDAEQLKQALSGVKRIKTGRPKKH